MTPQKSQYQAYSLATQTVAKTRQVVMLYDGAIRFIKQAKEAVAEKRIEDRFNLLVRASKVITGLQSSIDFTNGGEVANVLHQFYTNMSVRILAINSKRDGRDLCDALISELKQMRDVWDQIDLSLVPKHSNEKSLADESITTPIPITAIETNTAIA